MLYCNKKNEKKLGDIPKEGEGGLLAYSLLIVCSVIPKLEYPQNLAPFLSRISYSNYQNALF